MNIEVQVVAPKRAALAGANARLQGAAQKLSTIRAKVAELRAKVADLEDKLMKVSVHLCSHFECRSALYRACLVEHYDA